MHMTSPPPPLPRSQQIREHRQKTFVTFSGFWPLRGFGVGGAGAGLSESVKKGKFVTKIFLSVNVE